MTVSRGMVVVGAFFAIGLAAPSQTLNAPKSPVRSAANAPAEQRAYCQSMLPSNGSAEPLRRICEFATSLREELPKYTCGETVARYQVVPGSPPDVKIGDVIAAEVTFNNGHDSYANVTLNHKPTKQTMYELSGMSSQGEFGGVLQAIFKPATAANFRFVKRRRLGSRPSMIYAFGVVPSNNKSWWLHVNKSLLFPGYKGVIWVDEATSDLMRLEVQTTSLPTTYPVVEITVATDYAGVHFRNGGTFPLPIRSETMALLQSGKTMKNVAIFNNCREFVVTHQILSKQ